MTPYFEKKSSILYGITILLVIFIATISDTHGEITQTTVAEEVLVRTPSIKEIPLEEVIPEGMHEYVWVTGSCDSEFEGGCLQVRKGPSASAEAAFIARRGTILKVEKKVTVNGMDWYKVVFDEWLRHPDRVTGDLYISAKYVVPFLAKGVETKKVETNKRIIVDKSDQMLYAYDGDKLFMSARVSTGVDSTPTPSGTFTVYKKTPTRYMQGPIPGVTDNPFDLPGVPWNLYFTEGGAVIHGAYWHDAFGTLQSIGCVNLSLPDAERLYHFADVGTKVIVRQ